jgi:CRISPR system Cascade subunit CasD
MSYLSIRWKGPMMALQGPKLDGMPQSLPIPTLAAVTGMLGAALGIARKDTALLQSIQDTMRIAVVVHRSGVELVDYQTADLSKRHMIGPMWSSGQTTVSREGSPVAITGTRQQFRPYLVDADMSCVIELLEAAPYSADELLSALDHPARPLFLGRTTCPPETRIAGEKINASTLSEAAAIVLDARGGQRLYLPLEAAEFEWGDIPISLPGSRDWSAHTHSGSQSYVVRSVP